MMIVNMKLLLVISCLAAARAAVTKRDASCEGPTINEVIHTKETLKTGLDRPYLLTTDHSTNTVYFSYSLDPDDKGFKSAKIDLNTKEYTEIDAVKNGYAQCVDAKTGDVYIGDDGIYKLNKTDNTAELYGAKGVNIWMMFFKNVLYYSDFNGVYAIVNGNEIKVKDFEVEYLVIDNNDDMFYANYTGLFRQRKGYKDAVYYEDTKSLVITGISIDLNDNVFLVAKNGIYAVDKLNNVLKLHLKIDDAFGVAFDDKNNIIYSDRTSVYKLRPTTYEECT